MPTITIDGFGSCEVDEGTRLVNAISDCSVDIGHRCGGHARCTTCRVEFLQGEPDTMTEAEYEKLQDKELLGEVRLSCQIVVEHDMSVRPLMRKETEGWDDTGPEPAEEVTPIDEWFSKAELHARE